MSGQKTILGMIGVSVLHAKVHFSIRCNFYFFWLRESKGNNNVSFSSQDY